MLGNGGLGTKVGIRELAFNLVNLSEKIRQNRTFKSNGYISIGRQNVSEKRQFEGKDLNVSVKTEWISCKYYLGPKIGFGVKIKNKLERFAVLKIQNGLILALLTNEIKALAKKNETKISRNNQVSAVWVCPLYMRRFSGCLGFLKTF